MTTFDGRAGTAALHGSTRTVPNIMARNEQLIRQHKILQVLERVRYGKTLEELRDDLVEELGLPSLHVRSVRRDLEALQAAGLDVAPHDSGRGKVWKLGPRAKGTYRITASATELIALSLGRDLMYPLAGTPFWIGIESFWNKIREELPETVVGHYEKYRQVLHVLGVPAKSYEKHQGILATLNRAIHEHRIVEIEYRSLGKPISKRQIEPLAVVIYQSSVYIVAAAREVTDPQQRIRHWKLDRFHKATALDEWFRPPDDFDVRSHLARGMGIFAGKTSKFRIRVSAYAAPFVLEDPWHPEQQVEPQADGSLLLTVPAVHEMEVLPKLLQLGGEATLLAPKASRKRLVEIARQLLSAHDDSTATDADE
ncbi:MAG TPA: WYL domain-containing protein [Pirellulaceae bacterium]|nr:WYL domain-containing protein [Pirellulaceae bacterium]